jgi:hypothetical protein
VCQAGKPPGRPDAEQLLAALDDLAQSPSETRDVPLKILNDIIARAS